MGVPSKIRDAFVVSLRAVLAELGEDPMRDGLLETPDRWLRALTELTSGTRDKVEAPKGLLAKTFEAGDYDQMIVKTGIPFSSTCEHHLMPFTGSVDIGYIPGSAGRVVGLSKLSRLVDLHARRLQIQERLTRSIADDLAAAIMGHRIESLHRSQEGSLSETLLETGVGVVVRAAHSCVSCRGVRKQGTTMVTSALIGSFKTAEVRAEFLSLIGDKR